MSLNGSLQFSDDRYDINHEDGDEGEDAAEQENRGDRCRDRNLVTNGSLGPHVGTWHSPLIYLGSESGAVRSTQDDATEVHREVDGDVDRHDRDAVHARCSLPRPQPTMGIQGTCARSQSGF